MSQEYYTAAVSSGAGRLHLVRFHILPLLRERFVSLFVTETISTLSLLGQLAIFSVFMGGTIRTFSPMTHHSRVHDWAGLVGQARFNIFSDPWILLGPLGGYILLLLSLHFIHEGMQIMVQKNLRN